MADTINLSDVSTKDDSKLKTGGRRKHNMTQIDFTTLADSPKVKKAYAERKKKKKRCPEGQVMVGGVCKLRSKVKGFGKPKGKKRKAIAEGAI